MGNHWLIGAALALTLSTPAVPQSREDRPVWNRPLAPFTVAGNVHYVGAVELGSYLLTSPKGHVLIDGAMPESADQIAANIRRLGFRLEDVRYLLISHAHMDHAGGLSRLKQLTGAKLLASAGDKPELETGRSAYRDDLWPSPPVAVDQVIRDGERLRIGETTLTAHLTPGHTKGCTSWSTQVR